MTTYTARQKRALQEVDRAISRALKTAVFNLEVHTKLIETQVAIDKAKRFGYYGELMARRTNATVALGRHERSMQVISDWGAM